MNLAVGWGLVFVGFASGAVIGLCAQNEGFLGGYLSRSRRLVRLGHIALVALGGLNVFWGMGGVPDALGSRPSTVAAWSMIVGGCTMGPVCFLTAWKWPLRVLFVIPTTALLTGAGLAFWGSLP